MLPIPVAIKCNYTLEVFKDLTVFQIRIRTNVVFFLVNQTTFTIRNIAIFRPFAIPRNI